MKYKIQYCKQKTEYTKSFYVILADGAPIGNPIRKRSDAIAICEFLNSVVVEEVYDSYNNTYKLDIY